MMIKKYIIVLPSLLLFTELNFALFFMIDCTETNGKSHPENVFNKCCHASVLQMNHKSQNPKEIYFTESHFKYFIEITSEDYSILNSNKSQVDEYQSVIDINIKKLANCNKNFQVHKTESPPISINPVKAEVILI